jgi:hypothetical protein
MQDQQYYSHNEGNVNETAGYVKREQPKEPENNQNQSEHRQHNFLPFIFTCCCFRNLCLAIQQPLYTNRQHRWLFVQERSFEFAFSFAANSKPHLRATGWNYCRIERNWRQGTLSLRPDD